MTKPEHVDFGKVVNGRINQALTKWCLHNLGEKWSFEKICQVAKELRVPAIEVVEIEDLPVLKKYGLVSALTSSHMFIRGMNNPLHWDECLTLMGRSIDANAEFGFSNLITFTGFADTSGAEKGSYVSPEQGMKNCIEGYKKIVGHAEKKNCVICLEPLNTRDGAEMKGHPGYQGDHLDYCIEIVNKVGSPALKLLFDVYHVQIMDGDIIRRIRSCVDLIGHVQVAGNPGRGEMDDTQEVNYPAVMRAFVESGYKGYVGLEYIATRDVMQGLKEAVTLLDV